MHCPMLSLNGVPVPRFDLDRASPELLACTVLCSTIIASLTTPQQRCSLRYTIACPRPAVSGPQSELHTTFSYSCTCCYTRASPSLLLLHHAQVLSCCALRCMTWCLPLFARYLAMPALPEPCPYSSHRSCSCCQEPS